MTFNLAFILFIFFMCTFSGYIYKNFSIPFSYKNHNRKLGKFKNSIFSVEYPKVRCKVQLLSKNKQIININLKSLCELNGILYPNFVIFTCKNNKIKILSKNDKLYNCTLKDIKQNYVVFYCSGIKEKIILSLKKAKKAKTKMNFSYKIKKNNISIFRLSPKNANLNVFTVKRKDVLNLISSGKIFYQMAVVPYYKNGKVIGFKVTGVKPHSFVYKMGIRRGDIILSVNGYPIRSMEEGFSAFERLKDASEVNIKVLRRGKEINLSYIIQD